MSHNWPTRPMIGSKSVVNLYLCIRALIYKSKIGVRSGTNFNFILFCLVSTFYSGLSRHSNIFTKIIVFFCKKVFTIFSIGYENKTRINQVPHFRSRTWESVTACNNQFESIEKNAHRKSDSELNPAINYICWGRHNDVERVRKHVGAHAK